MIGPNKQNSMHV
jgi:hypothetical protein